MSERAITPPGQAHPITIEENSARITVRAGSRVVATSVLVLTLREAPYPAVQYIPRSDSTWPRLCAVLTGATASTRARPRISASGRTANALSTPLGPTKTRSPPWPKSRPGSRSTRIAWTPSRSSRPVQRFSNQREQIRIGPMALVRTITAACALTPCVATGVKAQVPSHARNAAAARPEHQHRVWPFSRLTFVVGHRRVRRAARNDNDPIPSVWSMRSNSDQAGSPST